MNVDRFRFFHTRCADPPDTFSNSPPSSPELMKTRSPTTTGSEQWVLYPWPKAEVHRRRPSFGSTATRFSDMKNRAVGWPPNCANTGVAKVMSFPLPEFQSIRPVPVSKATPAGP